LKPGQQLPLVELAILLVAAWQARDLLNAWHHSPHDRLGWCALLAWLSPLAIRLAAIPQTERPANPFLLGAAIGASLLSELTELHVFGQVALALAIAAWMKMSCRSQLWLLAAVAWMPGFGWWLSHCSAGTILALRLLLALGGGVLCLA